MRLMATFFFVSSFGFFRLQLDPPNRAYRAVAVPAYAARERVRMWAAAGKGRGGVGAAIAAAWTAVMLAAMTPFAVAGLLMVAWKDGGRGVVVKARGAMNVNNSMGAI